MSILKNHRYHTNSVKSDKDLIWLQFERIFPYKINVEHHIPINSVFRPSSHTGHLFWSISDFLSSVRAGRSTSTLYTHMFMVLGDNDRITFWTVPLKIKQTNLIWSTCTKLLAENINHFWPADGSLHSDPGDGSDPKMKHSPCYLCIFLSLWLKSHFNNQKLEKRLSKPQELRQTWLFCYYKFYYYHYFYWPFHGSSLDRTD